MSRHRALALVFALLMAPLALQAGQQIHRCSLNGAITYQADPCPSGQSRPTPTVQQLNAERQKRLQQAADGVGSTPAPGIDPARTADTLPAPAPAKAAKPGAFRCDGRQFCSQMTSCAEARYFLSHCPDVHMDGNHDGVPCERQWCRP